MGLNLEKRNHFEYWINYKYPIDTITSQDIVCTSLYNVMVCGIQIVW